MMGQFSKIVTDAKQDAAGVLARLFLALESDDLNPASTPLTSDEIALRQVLLDAAFRTRDRNSKDAIAQVLDEIDSEIEEVAPPVDVNTALARLGNQAALPSDVYKIGFGRTDIALDAAERHLTTKTIKRPHLIHEFGQDVDSNRPSLISMFGRWFEHADGPEIGRERFLLLVLGKRIGATLDVAVAYRLYPSEMNLLPSMSLLEMLRQFATWTGNTFSIIQDDKSVVYTGSFLYHARVQARGDTLSFKIEGAKGSRSEDDHLASMLIRRVDDVFDCAFGMVINVTAYERYVKKHSRLKKSFVPIHVKQGLSLKASIPF